MILRDIRRVFWSDEVRYPFNPDVISNLQITYIKISSTNREVLTTLTLRVIAA